MRTVEKQNKKSRLNESLKNSGMKLTRQRKLVYDTLLEKLDHPTAEDLFFRARKKQPEISMATVYNCLEALVKCGLVKQVKVGKTAVRYCANLCEHAHFVCEVCGAIFDLDRDNREKFKNMQIKIPRGFKIHNFEIAIHGTCSDCNILRI